MEFIRMYWTQIMFFLGIIGSVIAYVNLLRKATLCSLRNDILDLCEKSLEKGYITQYRLDAILHTFEIYKKLKGNSFCEALVNRVKQLPIIEIPYQNKEIV